MSGDEFSAQRWLNLIEEHPGSAMFAVRDGIDVRICYQDGEYIVLGDVGDAQIARVSRGDALVAFEALVASALELTADNSGGDE